MRIIILTFLTFNLINIGLAQSKKEIDQRIFQLEMKLAKMDSSINSSCIEKMKEKDEKIQELESKIINLQNDINIFKNNFNNTSTILEFIKKDNLLLEGKIKEYGVEMAKIKSQNDSLLKHYKLNPAAQMISNPSNEEDSIVYVIQSYFSCKTWEDRLSFVLKPEKVKPLMKNYYDYYKAKEMSKEKLIVQGNNFKINDIIIVFIVGYGNFYCKKTNAGFKIDWEASVGYNAMPTNTFKANLSNTAEEFRVNATIDNYFNYNYRESSGSHWSVKIMIDESLSGYISKNSTEGKRLYEILKDGKTHALILLIKTDSTQDKSGNTVIIEKVVKEGWYKD